jgi:hypothetical protein
MKVFIQAFLCFTALASGSFAYVWFFDMAYGIAIERSFFQAVAIAVYVFIWGDAK